MKPRLVTIAVATWIDGNKEYRLEVKARLPNGSTHLVTDNPRLIVPYTRAALLAETPKGKLGEVLRASIRAQVRKAAGG